MQTERKIIQVAASIRPDWSVITALCNDGTVWELLNAPDAEWSALPPIPQNAGTDNSEGE